MSNFFKEYVLKTGSYVKMATKNEHPERFGWWLNELESLGVSPKRQEVSNLTENLNTKTRVSPDP
jgi:hypothetical protein